MEGQSAPDEVGGERGKVQMTGNARKRNLDIGRGELIEMVPKDKQLSASEHRDFGIFKLGLQARGYLGNEWG
ncbi:MAG: hypothetical protein AAFO91_16545 [Bacteroidota bacterium]